MKSLKNKKLTKKEFEEYKKKDEKNDVKLIKKTVKKSALKKR